jgi:hypothetical protein
MTLVFRNQEVESRKLEVGFRLLKLGNIFFVTLLAAQLLFGCGFGPQYVSH